MPCNDPYFRFGQHLHDMVCFIAHVRLNHFLSFLFHYNRTVETAPYLVKKDPPTPSKCVRAGKAILYGWYVSSPFGVSSFTEAHLFQYQPLQTTLCRLRRSRAASNHSRRSFFPRSAIFYASQTFRLGNLHPRWMMQPESSIRTCIFQLWRTMFRISFCTVLVDR